MTDPAYQIGPWHFDPREPVLRGEAGERGLEDRAARTLEVLCRRRGDIVAKEELLAAVWDNRTVSANSVAIVIGALRRALDDDPRAPAYIETVGKRGYRLAASSPVRTTDAHASEARRFGRRSWISGAILAGTIVTSAVLLRPFLEPTTVLVEQVSNETGRAALDPLALSLGLVLLDSAARLPDVRVAGLSSGTAIPGNRSVLLRARLIIWDGAPELAITAVDAATGTVIWSSFVAGPPGTLAQATARRMATLKPRLDARLNLRFL